MSDTQTLKAAFEQALLDAKELSERPDNATLLKLYAFYKQGSLGDNTEPRPGFSDFVARAKWDAWTALKGGSPEAAMQQYIDLVGSLD